MDIGYIKTKLKHKRFDMLLGFFMNEPEARVQRMVEEITGDSFECCSKEYCYNSLIDWYYKNEGGK